MKKSLVILSLAAILAAGSIFAVAYGAGTAGTESDPLVTKSYVDSVIEELKASLSSSEKTTESSESSEEGSSESSKESEQASVQKDGYIYCEEFTVVNFSEGDKVILGAGSEFILRKKNSIKVLDDTTNGIPDLTSGSTLYSGTNIPRDHLFVVPRDDGRGFVCTTSSIVMIKGCYTVE